MNSYWEKLAMDVESDLLIVGCGFTGLFTALYLKKKLPHLKIQIVEQLKFGAIASTRNAGFACFGSISELADDLRKNTFSQTVQLVKKRWRGLQRLTELVPKEVMEFQQAGGREIFTEDFPFKNKFLGLIADYNHALESIIGPGVFTYNNDSEYGTKEIFCAYEGQLNPGKLWLYLRNKALSRGINISAGVKVTKWEELEDKVKITTSHGFEYFSSQLLFAVNGFASGLTGEQSIKPARNIVLLSKPIKGFKLEGNYHAHQGFIYYRSLGERLLIGGGRHWNIDREYTSELVIPEDLRLKLESYARKHVKGAATFVTDKSWAGIMGIGTNKNPILKRLGQRTLLAAGLGGMGVAIANVFAGDVANKVLDALNVENVANEGWYI